MTEKDKYDKLERPKPLSMTFKCDDYEEKLRAFLRRNRYNNRFNDVEVVAENETFNTNFIFLASTCKYFEPQIPAQKKTREEKVMKFIAPDGLTANTMTKVLDFIYEGGIKLNKDNIDEMLEASELLQMKSLRECCDKYIAQENARYWWCNIL